MQLLTTVLHSWVQAGRSCLIILAWDCLCLNSLNDREILFKGLLAYVSLLGGAGSVIKDTQVSASFSRGLTLNVQFVCLADAWY